MSSKVLTEIKFTIEKTIAWGVKKGKRSGFTVPIVFDMETRETIKSLVSEYKTESSPCGIGGTVYIKTKNLCGKQRKELNDKGETSVLIHIKVTVNERANVRYLTFNVTKSCKHEDIDEDSRPED